MERFDSENGPENFSLYKFLNTSRLKNAVIGVILLVSFIGLIVLVSYSILRDKKTTITLPSVVAPYVCHSEVCIEATNRIHKHINPEVKQRLLDNVIGTKC